MPRRPRVFIEGLTYHVYNRVGRGEASHMRPARDRLNTYLAPFNTSARLGAWKMVRVPIATDEAHELQCSKAATGFNQCTWGRLWRRRLCRYNTGAPDTFNCPYANEIMDGTVDRPGAGWFAPQP
jgi:hypothetical protein